jgi:hypothetical protein
VSLHSSGEDEDDEDEEIEDVGESVITEGKE